VRVDGDVVARIGRGVVLLVGVGHGDDAAGAERFAAKVARMRVFAGESSSFELTLADVGGTALVVSQFTLLAETGKGTRPSLSAAAPPELAEPVYDAFCNALRSLGIPVATGAFGAAMEVELVNEGPVTLLLS
jgi:D-tyrosyl-tRNA(Tyr) deacylase